MPFIEKLGIQIACKDMSAEERRAYDRQRAKKSYDKRFKGQPGILGLRAAERATVIQRVNLLEEAVARLEAELAELRKG